MVVSRETRIAIFLGLALATVKVGATVIYDETVDGPLSNDRLSPTALNLSTGTNDVIGSIGPNTVDNDHFSFTLGPSQLLNSIILSAYDDPQDPGNASRFDIFVGATAGVPASGFITTGMSYSEIGKDLLLAGGPLGPDETFTIGLQESDGTVVSYRLTLNTSEVNIPEPATLALFGLGLAGIGAVRRRKAA